MEDVPRKVYLAGPMSGYAEHNFPLFNEAAGRLRRQGYEVFNPAENARGDTQQPRAFYMRLDIPELMNSYGVVVLPGWRRSRGANLEVWIAIDLGMPVYQYGQVDGAAVLERLGGLECIELPFDIDSAVG